MKIMTFNLKCHSRFRRNNSWIERKIIVKNLIDKYKCDIIGIQECTDLMLKDLQFMLPEYKFIGEPRTKSFFKERNCILVRNDIYVYEQNTIWLSNTPHKPFSSLWYSVFPRICTSAIVGNNEKVLICNTHLDCFLDKAREKQSEILLSYINTINVEGYPVILMGDFNATPESDVVRNITSNMLVNGKFKSVTDKNSELYLKGTRVGFKNRDKGDYIDYIFVTEPYRTKDVALVKYNINGKFPSDHIPLYAEIEKI